MDNDTAHLLSPQYLAHRDSVTHLSEACDGCPGRCCTGRFWSAATLTEEEQNLPLFADVVTISEESGNPVIPFGEDDRCPFLSKVGKCTIYEDRPLSCRSYVCHSSDKRSVEIIYDYQALRKHLSKKGLMPRRSDYDRPYFYVVGEYLSAQHHLREFRGRTGVEMGRFYPKTEEYKVVGRFDEDGNFTRT